MPSGNEILIIAIVVMILFGATAIPKFARSLGKAKREFEKGVREGGKDDESTDKAKETKEGEAESAERKPREL